jgi:predicted exporter
MMRYGAWLWLLVIVIAAIYLSFRAVTGIVLESNILALLPRAERDAAAQNVQDRIAESFSRRVIFLVGDASPGKAAAAARKLSAALEHSGTIASLTSKLDPDAQRRMAAAYFLHRSGLLSDADRAALLAGQGKVLVSRALSVLYGAGGFANAKLVSHDPFLLLPAFFVDLPAPKSRFALDDGVLSVRSGGITYVLVSADLAGDPFSMKFQETFGTAVSGAISGLKAEAPDLNILRTGAVFYAHDSTSEAMQETSIIGLASLAATLALIFLVFRGLRPIVLGFLAIGIGVLCAFTGTLIIFGQIHAVALLLGVSLIGISVDYSLQYFCEYFDPAAVDPQSRLRRVLPGVAIGLATTLIGYCTLLLAPFPGLRQVATISLIGLASSFLTVMLWYPLLDRRHGSTGGERFVKLAAHHWALWEAPGLIAARAAIVSVCAVAALTGLFFLRADDDVRHLQSLSPDLKRQEAEVERLTGSSAGTQFLLVRGASQEALLQAEEKLLDRLAQARRKGALDGYTAMAQFVPSIMRQEDNRALVRDRLDIPYLSTYLQQIGYRGAIDADAAARFLTAADLPKVGPLSLLPLLDVTASGHPAHVVLLHGVTDPGVIASSIADMPGIRLVSMADDWSRLFGTFRRYAVGLLGLSALLMYPLLCWRYGFGRGLRVLAPALAAVVLTPPLAALAGISFTFFNAMALVLVLSVGVDYSVFCCETSGARKPVTALAIALAALSTILSFGMLAFSKVFAVHALGTTMLIGISLAFLFAPAAGDAGPSRKMKVSP